MSETKRKLDLFPLLGGLSKKNITAYTSLSDEAKKDVLPLIIMRWMSGTPDARQVYFLNELVNPFVFPFYKHKDLLISLLTICGSGHNQRYVWNKALSKKTAPMPTATKVVKQYFGYNTVDANDAVRILSAEDITDYAEQLGWQSDEMSKLKRELKSKK